MSADFVKMIEKNSRLLLEAGAAANIHILGEIKKNPTLRGSKTQELILESLQQKFLTGEAQLDLTKDQLFELIQTTIELAEPKYVEMYQAMADFIQENIYLFPLEESEEILIVSLTI